MIVPRVRDRETEKILTEGPKWVSPLFVPTMISNIAAVPGAISGSAILVSWLFSVVIGIVFGFIPSVKAANLNPIDALRYE